MMTLEQLYKTKLVEIHSRDMGGWSHNTSYSTYVTLRTKELYVKVISGPSKGTIGKVNDIEPKYNGETGEHDLAHASISYTVNNDPNVFWVNGSMLKRVQAKDAVFQKSCKLPLVYVSNRKKPQPRFTYAHFNALGQALTEGSFVVSVMDGGLVFGTINKITRTNIRITFGGKEYTPSSVRNTIVIDNVDDMKQDAMAAMLAGWDGSMWHLPDAKTIKTKIKKVEA